MEKDEAFKVAVKVLSKLMATAHDGLHYLFLEIHYMYQL